MSRLAADLSALVEDELRAFNLERMYATDKSSSAVAIVEAARQLPMMGDRRVVVVLRAEKILKPQAARARSRSAAEADDGEPGARRRRARSVRQEPGAADGPDLRRVRRRSQPAPVQGAAEAGDDRRMLGTEGQQGRAGRPAAGRAAGRAAGAAGGRRCRAADRSGGRAAGGRARRHGHREAARRRRAAAALRGREAANHCRRCARSRQRGNVRRTTGR